MYGSWAQSCGQILLDSFETYKTILRCKITELESTFKIIFLGNTLWEWFFKLLNNNDNICNKNATVN